LIPGVTYQWVDCLNGYSYLSGETNPNFTPTASGSYAVIVEDNGCSEMSSCQDFSFSFIDENIFGISVYPNPSEGTVYVYFRNFSDFEDILILNTLGQKVAVVNVYAPLMEVSLPDACGIYYLQFITRQGSQLTHIITKS
jgi:hypothetical protein